MSITPAANFDRYPHGCEVVIPIVLRIHIYVEPVVIERAARCYDAQSEIASLKNQLSSSARVAPADVPATLNLNMDSPDVETDVETMDPVDATLRPLAGWHSFGRAIQDLFETGMAGRARFLQQ